MPDKHARLAPSGSSGWMNCPGRPNAELMLYEERLDRGEPEGDGENEYTLEGTLAHTVLERMVNGQDVNVGDQLAEPHPMHDGKVDAEMHECITQVATEVTDYWLEGYEIYSEIKVDPGIPDCWGTVDLGIFKKSTMEAGVEDLKYGKGNMVEVEDNSQLMIYLCGFLEMLCHQGHATTWDDFTKLWITVRQPRGHHPDGPTRTAEVTVEELRAFHAKAITSAKATMEKDAPRTPGDAQCQWCHYANRCPERAEIIVGRFGVVELVKKVTAGNHNMTDEDEVWICDNADLIIKFVKETQENRILAIERGEPGLGFKVIQGQSKRQWVNSDTDTIAALKKLGLPPGDSQKLVLRTPKQVEDAIKKQIKEKNQKDATAKRKWKAFDELVYKPPGKAKLVREHVSGKPMPTAEQMFTDDIDKLL